MYGRKPGEDLGRRPDKFLCARALGRIGAAPWMTCRNSCMPPVAMLKVLSWALKGTVPSCARAVEPRRGDGRWRQGGNLPERGARRGPDTRATRARETALAPGCSCARACVVSTQPCAACVQPPPLGLSGGGEPDQAAPEDLDRPDVRPPEAHMRLYRPPAAPANAAPS